MSRVFGVVINVTDYDKGTISGSEKVSSSTLTGMKVGKSNIEKRAPGLDVVKLSRSFELNDSESGLQSIVHSVTAAEWQDFVSVYGGIYNKSGDQVGYFSRHMSFENGDLTIRNAHFNISEEYQNKGFGYKFFRQTEESYKSNTVKSINLTANIEVGGYAWAKMGFRFKDASTARFQNERLQKEWNDLAVKKENYVDGRPVSFPRPQTKSNYPGGENGLYWESFELASMKAPWDKPGDVPFGKRMLMGTAWDGVKSLDENDVGYRAAQLYYQSKYPKSLKHLTGQHNQKLHGNRLTDKIRVPADIRAVCDRLEKSGFMACAVGGAVRDALLGKDPHDWDLATQATPDQMRAVFGDKIRSNNGEAHGTLLVLTPKGAVEVTSFRFDTNAHGRSSDVEFGASIEEDLQRRDLTVNALAFRPSTGHLYGPGPGGSPKEALADLNNHVARFVGDGYLRIQEDELRAVRLPRFARKMDGTMAPESMNAVLAYGPLTKLTGERIRGELNKTFALGDPDKSMADWQRLGLVEHTLPEVHALGPDAWGKAMVVLANLPKLSAGYPNSDSAARALDGEEAGDNPKSRLQASMGLLSMAALLQNNGYQSAERILDKGLHTDKKSIAMIVNAIRNNGSVPKIDTSDSGVRRWVRKNQDHEFLVDLADAVRGSATRSPKSLFEEMRNVRRRVAAAQRLRRERPFPVTGLEIMAALKIKPGPEIGRILEKLQERYDDDPYLTQGELLNFASML